MNTLEANSIRIGNSDGEMLGMDILSNLALTLKARNPVPSAFGNFDIINRKAAPLH
jgi:hypothetical protein